MMGLLRQRITFSVDGCVAEFMITGGRVSQLEYYDFPLLTLKNRVQ